MMKLGIFYSSYNNYNLLADECLSKIDYDGVEVINIDDHSSEEQQEFGKKVCYEADIPFFINQGKGLHNATSLAINYFKEKDIDWVLCMQQDVRPLGNNFFIELNEYIKKYDTKELGAFGFNVLYTKKYTKKAYSEYLSGNKPQGWLGTFPLSDKRSLWQKAFIFDLVKYYIKKMLFNNTAFMVHVYRRWFSEETFKQFKFLSNKYKGLVSIDLPAWPVVAINIDLWDKYIVPDNNFIFHLWFNDIAFQFMNSNIYVGVCSDFYIFNNQEIKTKYGMKESSASEGKKQESNFVEPIKNQLKYFKKKWGFSYENTLEDYPKVQDRYNNTLIDKTFQHNCMDGPLKRFKKYD